MKNFIVLILTVSTVLLAGCCTAHHTTKWEYQTLTGVGISKINQMADEGWSVAGFSQYESGGTIITSYLLKRPLK